MFSTEFLLTSLIVVLIPGTGVIYTISSALFIGKRASVAAALGCTAGIIPHLVASILGLSAILHMSALAFQTIKYLGVVYLLYLAWGMWNETGALQINSTASTKKLYEIATKGFLINILNPKLSIFFLSFLPLFIPANSSSPIIHLFSMSLVFMLITLVVFIVYGISANYVKNYIVNSQRATTILQRSFAIIFAALGIKLAAAEQ
ncbi:MAG: LysE family translocator [Desulforhopalus sp.]